jgi:hypothetical protein
LTGSKFFIIILSLILIYNIAVAVAEEGFLVTPSNGTYEINKTIEKLIASNEESSQRMEQLTREVKLLNEKLVTYTRWLLLLTIILSIFAFINVIQFVLKIRTNNKQKINEKQRQRVYVGHRFRKIRLW